MNTDENKPLDKAMTVDEFNAEMKKWTFRVRQKIIRRLRKHATHGKGEAVQNIRTSFKYDLGEIYSTGFKFPYYLVFIHYGVGRGYVRQGGIVVRGHRDDNSKFKRYRGKPAKTWKDYSQDHRPINRKPYDWLDSVISNNFESLADLAAEYHGDKITQEVMKQKNKFLIEKK